MTITKQYESILKKLKVLIFITDEFLREFNLKIENSSQVGIFQR